RRPVRAAAAGHRRGHPHYRDRGDAREAERQGQVRGRARLVAVLDRGTGVPRPVPGGVQHAGPGPLTATPLTGTPLTGTPLTGTGAALTAPAPPCPPAAAPPARARGRASGGRSAARWRAARAGRAPAGRGSRR